MKKEKTVKRRRGAHLVSKNVKTPQPHIPLSSRNDKGLLDT
jgi:hypothetical protein